MTIAAITIIAWYHHLSCCQYSLVLSFRRCICRNHRQTICETILSVGEIKSWPKLNTRTHKRRFLSILFLRIVSLIFKTHILIRRKAWGDVSVRYQRRARQYANIRKSISKSYVPIAIRVLDPVPSSQDTPNPDPWFDRIRNKEKKSKLNLHNRNGNQEIKKFPTRISYDFLFMKKQ